jgi:hypothetical protein
MDQICSGKRRIYKFILERYGFVDAFPILPGRSKISFQGQSSPGVQAIASKEKQEPVFMIYRIPVPEVETSIIYCSESLSRFGLDEYCDK